MKLYKVTWRDECSGSGITQEWYGSLGKAMIRKVDLGIHDDVYADVSVIEIKNTKKDFLKLLQRDAATG